ncbi:hypothetical protein GGI11_005263 [Coemansia sp. RSA 2049]|nr:hypothetical protein GGI11_005263 [Coemansia sp. RSA 2049]
MASTGGMQTVIDEIRHSRNWIAQIVSSKRHEQQRAMLLHSPPTQPASGAQAIPLQQVPPVCHVQRHTADDDSADGGFLADEERAAAERQLKFHHHRCRRSTTDDQICALVSGASAADSSESQLVSPAADDYDGPPKHGLCCGQQTSSTTVAITTKAVMFGLTQVMLLVFVAALCADARSRPVSPGFWHPLIMAAMLVLSVEATAVLQVCEWPIPPHRKRTLHVAHIALHCLSAAAGVAGIGECIYFKRRMLTARAHPPQQEEEGAMALPETTNSSPTFSSSSGHACVGKLAVFLFLCQLVFGAYVRFSSLPTRAAGQQPKHYLKKYHRAAGYAVLLFLWLSAWLGIHSRQRVLAGGQEAGGLVGTWIWALVFVGLLVGILVPIDRAKFGFK